MNDAQMFAFVTILVGKACRAEVQLRNLPDGNHIAIYKDQKFLASYDSLNGVEGYLDAVIQGKT